MKFNILYCKTCAYKALNLVCICIAFFHFLLPARPFRPKLISNSLLLFHIIFYENIVFSVFFCCIFWNFFTRPLFLSARLFFSGFETRTGLSDRLTGGDGRKNPRILHPSNPYDILTIIIEFQKTTIYMFMIVIFRLRGPFLSITKLTSISHRLVLCFKATEFSNITSFFFNVHQYGA